jgi:hypothetical protein
MRRISSRCPQQRGGRNTRNLETSSSSNGSSDDDDRDSALSGPASGTAQSEDMTAVGISPHGAGPHRQATSPIATPRRRSAPSQSLNYVDASDVRTYCSLLDLGLPLSLSSSFARPDSWGPVDLVIFPSSRSRSSRWTHCPLPCAAQKSPPTMFTSASLPGTKSWPGSMETRELRTASQSPPGARNASSASGRPPPHRSSPRVTTPSSPQKSEFLPRSGSQMRQLSEVRSHTAASRRGLTLYLSWMSGGCRAIDCLLHERGAASSGNEVLDGDDLKVLKVDMLQGQHLSPSFVRAVPRQKLPALVISTNPEIKGGFPLPEDKKSAVICEAGAILRYKAHPQQASPSQANPKFQNTIALDPSNPPPPLRFLRQKDSYL